MTPQLLTAFKRSFVSAVPVALSSGGAVASEVLLSANPKFTAITAGAGALGTVAVVFFRTVVEGLSDAQRAKLGKVIDSDVVPVATTAAEGALDSAVEAQLAKVGVKLDDAQLNSLVSKFEDSVKTAFADASKVTVNVPSVTVPPEAVAAAAAVAPAAEASAEAAPAEAPVAQEAPAEAAPAPAPETPAEAAPVAPAAPEQTAPATTDATATAAAPTIEVRESAVNPFAAPTQG